MDDVVPLTVRAISVERVDSWRDETSCQGTSHEQEDASEQSSRDLESSEDFLAGSQPLISEEQEEASGQSSRDLESSEDSLAGSRPRTCNWLGQYSAAEIRTSQMADSDLRVLLTWMEQNHQPNQRELQLCSAGVKRFWRYREQLCRRQGVLYYQWEDPPQCRLLLLVPSTLKNEVLQGCHDSPTGGHLGQQKTYERLRQKYIWYEMSVDAKLYVRSCSVCNRQKRPTVKPKAALGSYHAGAPMERVHIDILGPLTESERGNKYVLLMVDQFTKWVEIHPLPDQSAERIARTVIDQVFSRFGSPVYIHSDQGRNFDGNLFKAVCQIYQVAKTRTTPYRPCSNGQVERYN